MSYYPYSVTSNIEGIIWVFSFTNHKKKIIDLRNINNLKSLDLHGSYCVIKRQRGRPSTLFYAGILGINEMNIIDSLKKQYYEDFPTLLYGQSIIYEAQFEAMLEYFIDNKLQINTK